MSFKIHGNDMWTPNMDFAEIVKKAREGSPYYQGLLGIFLRSGEAGSKVDISLSKQWSEVAYKQSHPFGAYNLANIFMLDGNFEEATQYYQDAALRLQRKASEEIQLQCIAWEK